MKNYSLHLNKVVVKFIQMNVRKFVDEVCDEVCDEVVVMKLLWWNCCESIVHKLFHKLWWNCCDEVFDEVCDEVFDEVLSL